MAEVPSWARSSVDAANRATAPVERKNEAAIEGTEAGTGSAQASTKRTTALLPTDIRKAEAGATKAEIEAQKAKDAVAAKAEVKRLMALRNAEDVTGILKKIQQARNNVGPLSMGVPGQVLQHVWGTDARDLHASLNAIMGPAVMAKLGEMKAQSATGASGFGALSEKELQLIKDSVEAIGQDQSSDQLMENLNRLEEHYRRFQAFTSGVDPRTPQGAVAAGITPPSEEPTGKVSAEGGMESDPRRKGLNATIDTMIRAGRTVDQIKAYANTIDPKDPKLGDRLQGVDAAIAHWKKWGVPANIDTERNYAPASEGINKDLGNMMLTPGGAAATGFVDATTGGLFDEATGLVGGDREKTEAIMKGVQEEHPGYATAGSVAGGVAQAAALGPLLSRYGISPGVTDTLMNVGYGAGSAQPGERLKGGAAGGVTGYIGDKTIKGITRVPGSMMAGAGSPEARALIDSDVPLTTGQTMGGQVKDWEDKKLNWPIIGPVLKQRRREAYGGYNLAAQNEGVAPIGGTITEPGVPGIVQAHAQVSDAYRRALDGTQVQPDTPFLASWLGHDRADLLRVHRVGQEIVDQADAIRENAVDQATGLIPGENFQIARQELQRLMKNYKTDAQYDQRIGPTLHNLQDSLDEMFARQFPDRAADFLNANLANRHVSILEDATLAAGNTGGIFTPAQLRNKSVANTKLYLSKRQAAEGNYPFRDLVEAGQPVLPASGPDSGTPGGMIAPLALATVAGGGGGASIDAATGDEGTGGFGTGAGLLAAGSLAALAGGPYSRRGQALSRSLFGGSNSPMVRNVGRLTNEYLAPGLAAGARPFTAGALINRTPNPDVPFRPMPVPPGAPPVVEPEEPAGLPPGASVDPETKEIVLPDGTRIPLPDEEPQPFAYGGAVRRLSHRYGCGGRVMYGRR